VDIETGKLDKKGEEGRLVANVIPNKIIPAGSKLAIRIAFKKFNGNTLVYLHSCGWAEVADLNTSFLSSKGIKDDIYNGDYNELSNESKIKLLKRYFPAKFAQLNKTEIMLMAVLENKDLVEVEKEFAIDRSLKSKIKKDTKKYENTFIKKLEESMVA